MRKFLTRRNIIIAIVVLIVGGFFWYRHQAASAVKPTLATVKRQDITESLTVSGQMRASRSANLNFPSSGKLAYVNVADGDMVTAGQALMGLDLGDLLANERAALYKYQAADANAKEIEDEVKGHDTDETFAQKNARVTAQASRDIQYDAWLSAQRAVNNASLVAPFSGVVTNVTATAVGDTVSITDGATVLDPSSLYFEVEIDESDLGKVHIGQAVQVKLDAFPGSSLPGTITEIDYVSRLSDTGANVFPAHVQINTDADHQLRYGMKGDTDIVLGQANNVLTLPIEAVVDDKVTLENGKTANVSTGLADDNNIEIKSGLSEGEKVIVK